MYVRRDLKRNALFHKQQRDNGLRNLLLMLVGLALTLLLVVYLQPAFVVSAVYQVMGVETTPTPLPSDLARQAEAMYYAGEMDDAERLLAQAHAQRPDDVAYMYEYGQILIDQDKPDQALALASRIGDINARDPRGFALRARALTWKGQSASAVPIGLAGLQVAPDFAPLYYALAWAYTGTQSWREAQEYGLMATELAPSDVRAYWSYATALSTVGAHEAAMEELERAIDVHSAFLPPYFELAFLYLSAGRDQEAIDLYDRILGMEPRNARALLRQCDAYRKVGEFERAKGLCRDAVDADPSFIPAQYRLGLLNYSDRAFEAARNNFETCLDASPGNLQCYYHLGLTHYYLDNCGTAWTMLQEALVMAQAQSNAGEAISTIREGLDAIDDDPRCLGRFGRNAEQATPSPAFELPQQLPSLPTQTPTPRPTRTPFITPTPPDGSM